MKKLSKLLSFILIISMLLCIPAFAAEPENKFEPTGKLGDDVYYIYDKDTRVLRIYGTGATYDYDYPPGPGFPPDPNPNYSPLDLFNGFNGRIDTFIIEDGVTYLGNNLLTAAPIQTIIAASVTTISSDFFYSISGGDSVYFYGNAPETKALTDWDDRLPDFYYLPGTEGWDKFEINKLDPDKREYVSIADEKLKTFCGAPYCDVAGDAWCADAVCEMWRVGLMNGTSIDYFSPNASLTRGMMATILYRMAGEPEYTGGAGSDKFADVGEGRFCDKAIGWASANGIVFGYEDGSFKPDRALNRQELAALLYRYDAKFTEHEVDKNGLSLDASTAADWDTVSSFAKEAMQWAVDKGIIYGTDSTKLVLAPFGTATRAQIAVMLSRYLTT